LTNDDLAYESTILKEFKVGKVKLRQSLPLVKEVMNPNYKDKG